MLRQDDPVTRERAAAADAQWGRLPLHTAASNGRPASVRRLLAYGADPNLRDPEHNATPLEESRRESSQEHREVVAILRPLSRGVLGE